MCTERRLGSEQCNLSTTSCQTSRQSLLKVSCSCEKVAARRRISSATFAHAPEFRLDPGLP
eukprot:2986235-Amphidinium_carterae.1